MKALICLPKFVVASAFILLASASSFAHAQPMRIRNVAPVRFAPMPMQMHNVAPVRFAPIPMQMHNVAPVPMHRSVTPPSVMGKTVSPMAGAKTTPSTTTTPVTPAKRNHQTPTQRQDQEQRRLITALGNELNLVADQDLSLLTRLTSTNNGINTSGINGINPFGTTYNPYASGINGFNPYGTTYNPYANSYATPANPYASTGASANSSGGYPAGNTYSSTYVVNPYVPSTPALYSSALKPTGGYGDTAAPAEPPTQDSKTQAQEVLGSAQKMSTLLTGLGVPNTKGQVVWPQGLAMLRPAGESHALRQQVSVDFRILVSQQLAGSENATFFNEGNIALARLAVLLHENEKSMAPAVYSEANQFLEKLQHALQVLQPGRPR